MPDPTITVRCACGWEAAGPEEEVVLATIEHGHRLHNMTATREDVLAMAVAAPERATADPSTPDDRP
jgi:predicted small metal-binding protein